VDGELVAIVEEVGCPWRWEDVAAFITVPAPDSRVPDIIVVDADAGRQYAVDIVTIGAQSEAITGPDQAAVAVEERKAAAYAECCRQVGGYTAQPFGIDTFGGLGEGAQRFIRRLAQLRCSSLRRDEDIDADLRFRHLYTQRIVTALLRSQAHILRRRCVFGAGSSDPGLPADSQHHGCLGDRSVLQSQEPAGIADLAYVELPALVP
jgi:hypothetical protein